jgi:hypothetical protein
MLPVITGAIAASLDDDSPMLAALAAGVLWAALLFVSGLMVDLRLTHRFVTVALVMRSVAMAMGILAAVAGGALRLRKRVTEVSSFGS